MIALMARGAVSNLHGELRAEVARCSSQLVRPYWKTFHVIALIATGPFAISVASFDLRVILEIVASRYTENVLAIDGDMQIRVYSTRCHLLW
jgi:hypothetical protein